MKLTRAKRTTPLRGPPSGRQGGMTTRRSVETLFCTASDIMAESDNCLDEIELRTTDVMLAKLTLSPCRTSTQLSVSADPPIKHGTKAKGEQKRQTHHFAYNSAHTTAEKQTARYNATCASCGFITNAWENGQKRSLACGAVRHAENCRLLLCNL